MLYNLYLSLGRFRPLSQPIVTIFISAILFRVHERYNSICIIVKNCLLLPWPTFCSNHTLSCNSWDRRTIKGGLCKCIRKNQEQGADILTAVNAAVDSCIRDGILADFLIRHKAEVMDVVLTEYDEAKHMKRIEKEAEERGEAIGQIKGAIKLARMTPDLSDQDIVSKIVNLFALSEDEAWEYVRNCK